MKMLKTLNYKWLLASCFFSIFWSSAFAQESIGLSYQPNFSKGNGQFITNTLNVNQYLGFNTFFKISNNWSLKFELLHAVEDYDYSHQFRLPNEIYIKNKGVLANLLLLYHFYNQRGKIDVYGFFGEELNLSYEQIYVPKKNFLNGGELITNSFTAYLGYKIGLGLKIPINDQWKIGIGPNYNAGKFFDFYQSFSQAGIQLYINYAFENKKLNDGLGYK